MRRRTFLLGSLATAGLAACGTSDEPRRAACGASGDTRVYGDVTLTRCDASADAPNVLFISLDDCNDWLGFLNNHPGTHTPNLDALAAESLVFNHAYTMAPMCLPSRTAVMFGITPTESGVYDHTDASRSNYQALQKVKPSLVDAYWAAGYESFAVGKIFHDRQPDRWDDSFRQPGYIPPSVRSQPEYSERFDPEWTSPYNGQVIGDGSSNNLGGPIDFGPSGGTAESDPDGQATAWAIDRLRDERRGPFFLGFGAYLPHEPYRLPQEFLDRHPIDDVVVPEFRPDDLDDLGPYARNEIINSPANMEQFYENGTWQKLVQAYQAAISYADWCVGQVLDELRSGPHADDTIVAVWSDHGFHLGEKLHLQKFTLWERATRVPLILNVPGRFDRAQTFDPPVSLIDVGPTVLDLSGIEPLPGHHGRSLLPVIDEPAVAERRPPITTWLAGNHAVRRNEWRYIRYRTGEVELYDVESDPDEFENLANDPVHDALKAELDGFLPPAAGSN